MHNFPDALKVPPKPIVVCSEKEHSIETSKETEGDLNPFSRAILFPNRSVNVRFMSLSQLTQQNAVRDNNPRSGNDKKTLSHYETLIPEGILKCSWIRKYFELKASVVLYIVQPFGGESENEVVMKDKEKDKEKENEIWRNCETEIHKEIENLKKILRPKNIRFLVAVLLPSRFKPTIEEKAVSLRRKVEIDSKSLYLGTFDDFFNTALGNIEKVLLNLAYQTIKDKVIRKKIILKGLQKNWASYYAYSARLAFKLGYLNEIRGLQTHSMKYYQHTLNTLKEMKNLEEKQNKVSVDFLSEIKSMIEITSFKLFLLQLANKIPVNEVVVQFQRNIRSFHSPSLISNQTTPSSSSSSSSSSLTRHSEFEFEHYAWLTRQYIVFGELLELANGVTDRGMLNAAFYYKVAVNFCFLRCASYQKICLKNKEKISSITSDISLFKLIDFEKTKYIGQLPKNELKIIKTLSLSKTFTTSGWLRIARELKYEKHYSDCLDLIKKTLRTLKLGNIPIVRSSRVLSLQRSLIYYLSGNTTKALKSARKLESKFADFDLSLSSQHVCSWAELHNQILLILRASAICELDFEESVRSTLKLLGIEDNEEKRNQLHKDLLSLIWRREIEPTNTFSQESSFCLPFNISSFPKTRFPQIFPLKFEMRNDFHLKNLLHFHCGFSKNSNPVINQFTYFKVSLKSFLSQPLWISAIHIDFIDVKYNIKVSNENVKENVPTENLSQFVVLPNKIWKMKFDIFPKELTILNVKRVSVLIGDLKSNSYLTLYWDESYSSQNYSEQTNDHFKPCVWSQTIASNISPLHIAVSHNPPALSGELYRFDVTFKSMLTDNTESLSNIKVNLEIKGNEVQQSKEVSFFYGIDENCSHHSAKSEEKPLLQNSLINISSFFIESIKPNEEIHRTVFVRTTGSGQRTVLVEALSRFGLTPISTVAEFSYSISNTFSAKFVPFDGGYHFLQKTKEKKNDIEKQQDHKKCEEIVPNSSLAFLKALQPLSFSPLSANAFIAEGNTVVLNILIRTISSHPITIHSVKLLSGKEDYNLAYKHDLNMFYVNKFPINFEPDSELSLWHSLSPDSEFFDKEKNANANVVNFGTLKLRWSRKAKNGQVSPQISSFLSLPKVNLLNVMFNAGMRFPSEIIARKPFQAILEIKNNTIQPLYLSINVFQNSNFLISGDTSSVFAIIPNGRMQIPFAFIPLQSGVSALPLVLISSVKQGSTPLPTQTAFAAVTLLGFKDVNNITAPLPKNIEEVQKLLSSTTCVFKQVTVLPDQNYAISVK